MMTIEKKILELRAEEVKILQDAMFSFMGTDVDKLWDIYNRINDLEVDKYGLRSFSLELTEEELEYLLSKLSFYYMKYDSINRRLKEFKYNYKNKRQIEKLDIIEHNLTRELNNYFGKFKEGGKVKNALNEILDKFEYAIDLLKIGEE